MSRAPWRHDRTGHRAPPAPFGCYTAARVSPAPDKMLARATTCRMTSKSGASCTQPQPTGNAGDRPGARMTPADLSDRARETDEGKGRRREPKLRAAVRESQLPQTTHGRCPNNLDVRNSPMLSFFAGCDDRDQRAGAGPAAPSGPTGRSSHTPRNATRCLNLPGSETIRSFLFLSVSRFRVHQPPPLITSTAVWCNACWAALESVCA